MSDWKMLNVSVPPKQIKNICGLERKRQCDGPYDYGQEEENSMLRITPITKKKTGQTG